MDDERTGRFLFGWGGLNDIMLSDVFICQVAGDVFRGFEPQRRDHVTVGASYEILFTRPIEGDLGGWHRFVWAKEPVERALLWDGYGTV